MKKTLIVLAVLGAASGAAVAQSSVTLYGVADVAIGKAGANGEKKWGAQSNSIVSQVPSRIGFTGKEDLGGGLWAGFRFEGAVNLAAGAFTGFARESTFLMGSDNWGTVKLGRALTPSFYGVLAWELTGEVDYSLVDNVYGWGAWAQPRTNVQLDYKTPTYAGLSAEVAYVPRADGKLLDGGYGTGSCASGISCSDSNTDRWDMNVTYVQGPVSAGLTFNKANRVNPAYAPLASKANYSLGAQYRIGNNFALAASYNHANYAQQWANGAGGTKVFAKRYGFSLGGKFMSGPYTVTLDLTRDSKNEIYGNNKKYTNGLLEGRYNLSKRTSLYADYFRLDGTNNYGIGVRHNF